MGIFVIGFLSGIIAAVFLIVKHLEQSKNRIFMSFVFVQMVFAYATAYFSLMALSSISGQEPGTLVAVVAPTLVQIVLTQIAVKFLFRAH